MFFKKKVININNRDEFLSFLNKLDKKENFAFEDCLIFLELIQNSLFLKNNEKIEQNSDLGKIISSLSLDDTIIKELNLSVNVTHILRLFRLKKFNGLDNPLELIKKEITSHLTSKRISMLSDDNDSLLFYFAIERKFSSLLDKTIRFVKNNFFA